MFVLFNTFFLKEGNCCPCTEHFLYAGTVLSALHMLFHPIKTPRKILLLAPFYRWGKWGSQRSRRFPTIARLGSGEVGFKSRSECKFLALDHCGTQAQTAVTLGEKVCFGLFWKSCHILFQPLSSSPTGLGNRRSATLELWQSSMWATAVVVTQQRPPPGRLATRSWEGHA